MTLAATGAAEGVAVSRYAVVVGIGIVRVRVIVVHAEDGVAVSKYATGAPSEICVTRGALPVTVARDTGTVVRAPDIVVDRK